MKKEKLNNMTAKDWLILSIILVIALVFRLYKINTPLADLHSWRQADTAAVARNFARNDFDLFHPKFDDLSNVQSGMENPNGYRFVEFPLYNALMAAEYKLLPVIPIEIYGRLTSIFFSFIIIGSIYYLLNKEINRISAIIASIIFATFPFFVFFSRVVLPESMAVATMFLSIVLLHLFIYEDSAKKWFLYGLSIIMFATSVLIKPMTIFYGLVPLYLFIYRYDISLVKKVFFYTYFIFSLLPLLMWRIYITQFPEGIPYNPWLINEVNNNGSLQSIFLHPAFFRWIFFQRINNIILGGYLTGIFLIGVLVKQKKFLFYSILLSAFAYLFVFEGGNVQHEYYQYIILPALAMFIGIGTNAIIKNAAFVSPYISTPLLLIVAALSFYFSYDTVKDYYNYATDLPQMARIISTLTKPTDKIITQRTGDTTLLYLSDRKGSPVLYKSLDEMKKDGYSYLVASEPDLIKQLKEQKTYQIVFENTEFTLFRL